MIKKIIQRSKNIIRKVFILIIHNYLSKNPLARTSCTPKTLRCSADIFNKNYQYYRIGKDTPICCVTHLYEILKDIIASLKKHNIDYFIFYGTHLGTVRHGGLIPWDTDIDLCIMYEEREKTLKIINESLLTKYTIEEINNYWLMINYSKKNKLHADIFFMQKKRDYIFLDGFEQFKFPINSIYPLKHLKFYDLTVTAPGTLAPLYLIYGENCLKESYHQYIDTGKSSIEPFLPAKIASCYMRKE